MLLKGGNGETVGWAVHWKRRLARRPAFLKMISDSQRGAEGENWAKKKFKPASLGQRRRFENRNHILQ